MTVVHPGEIVLDESAGNGWTVGEQPRRRESDGGHCNRKAVNGFDW
jgi:hypothetical protein